MPFRFHLKRSKQYNVVSKSLFVISVELLDNNTMECTLSSESTGQDCLQNVGQRLGLHQPEFFGLRYISRRSSPKHRWIDLDRPLKRQLDKHAQEPNLYLGVMFYVTDVNLLKDEVTRYHYFLQLKADVIDGKMMCSIEQAISLAGYSLQAEFGDYDPERHTTEYLKEFALLPKDFINSEETLGAVIESLVHHYAGLVGFPPALAEIYYIVGAQQLDGYGQECFVAKDEAGNEVLVGSSTVGVALRKRDGQPITFYRWAEIANLLHHKKYLGIECTRNERVTQFHFEEPDAAKYVWKLCLLQHSFFKQNQPMAEASVGALPLNRRTFTTSSGTAPAFLYFEERQPSQHRGHLQRETSSNPSLLHLTGSSYSLSSSHPSHPQDSSPASAASNTASHPDLERLRSMLPTYRPAPDYETAVRHKYGNSNVASPLLYSAQADNASSTIPSLPGVRAASFGAQYGSQPEISPKVTQEVTNNYENISSDRTDGYPMLLQSLHYSTPELSSQGEGGDVVTQELVRDLQMMHLYKPPPPYPSVRTISNSTPDLARQLTSNAQVGGSSPDLVSGHPSAQPMAQSSATAAGAHYSSQTVPVHNHQHLQMLQAMQTQEALVGYREEVPHPQMKQYQVLEWKLQEGQVFAEFQSLPRGTSSSDTPKTAFLPENHSRNRFQDALPFESTRVQLTPSRENPSGYINASHISSTVSGGLMLTYIAAESPSSHTANAFWQMVWECGVRVVAMLTPTEEGAGGSPSRVVRYWPREHNTALRFGEFQVCCGLSQSSGSCPIVKLQVYHVPSKHTRTIWHLHYTHWGEGGIPTNILHFLSFLEELASVRQIVQNEVNATSSSLQARKQVSSSSSSLVNQGSQGPLLVHCAAGIGRTGVTILCDILLHSVDHNQELDIPRVLHHLRRQRVLMVQTAAQYKFVYMAVIEYLKCSRLI